MDTDMIVVVEDEERMNTLLCEYLKKEEYKTTSFYSGENVPAWVRANKTSLLLLDLMLPGKDGLEICKDIRQFSDIPIIMVTARVEEIDRLLGLNLGADDYICKPFSPREVVARVKAVLRRSSGKSGLNNLVELDPDRYLATIRGEKIDLTAVEFQLLTKLYDNSGRIFSRDLLMDHIYDDQRIVCDRTIDSHIKKLRKKIAAVAPDLDIIRSVYGVGYKYEPPA